VTTADLIGELLAAKLEYERDEAVCDRLVARDLLTLDSEMNKEAQESFLRYMGLKREEDARKEAAR
jgi:hypothetical protein